MSDDNDKLFEKLERKEKKEQLLHQIKASEESV
jgi:hypothetical protein